MIEAYRTAFGWHIRRQDPRHQGRWLYISATHKDGTYDYSTDYLYAKSFGERTARKHLEILEKEG